MREIIGSLLLGDGTGSIFEEAALKYSRSWSREQYLSSRARETLLEQHSEQIYPNNISRYHVPPPSSH